MSESCDIRSAQRQGQETAAEQAFKSLCEFMKENATAGKMSKNLLLQIIIVILLIVVIVLLCFILSKPGDEAAPGGILYLRENRVDRESDTELVLIDGEGYREQRLGDFTSTPAWSHDGNYIAVGCADPSRICILDAHTIPQARIFPTGNVRLSPTTITELDIPHQCKEIDARLLHISWAPTSEEVALVCANTDNTIQEVCFLSIENESSCWDYAESQGVMYIDWSPTDMNQLLISGDISDAPEIYITDRDGGNRTFLDNGWSAAWSSDGKRVAFFRWRDGRQRPDETQWTAGIAAIQSDGTGLTWFFQSWAISIDPIDYIYFDSLDWSPDDRYIVFAGNYVDYYSSTIFRLEIETGEIILLSNPLNRYRQNIEPSWGP